MDATIARRPDAPGLFLALAPMDGVTDAVYREVLTDLFGGRSGISACVSEFVRVCRDPLPAKVLLRAVPELRQGGLTRAGVPVHLQLLGGDPRPLAATAAIAAALGAPAIDLNFGCPAKTVNNHDGGATLLKAPPRIAGIVAAVREAVPPAIPVSAKIRIGWESGDGIEAIVDAAAAGGAAWITVHARTRAQGYKPPVHWQAIGRAALRSPAPIVANGDLFTPEDLQACAAVSGARAFMIGRGSMAAPELFARVRGERAAAMGLGELAELWRIYYERLLAAGAPPPRALCRVKQWLRYGGERSPAIAGIFAEAKTAAAWAEVEAAIERALASDRPARGAA